MKIRIKGNGTLYLWKNEMEDSIFIKTEDAFGKFCFWFRYQISGKNKNKRFKSMGDLEPVKCDSAFLSV